MSEIKVQKHLIQQQYYYRTQVQSTGISEDRIQALMFFLWGNGELTAGAAECKRCDLEHLRKMINMPVEVKLTLEEVES